MRFILPTTELGNTSTYRIVDLTQKRVSFRSIKYHKTFYMNRQRQTNSIRFIYLNTDNFFSISTFYIDTLPSSGDPLPHYDSQNDQFMFRKRAKYLVSLVIEHHTHYIQFSCYNGTKQHCNTA